MLKWNQPQYAALLSEMMAENLDFARRPVEDFARASVKYVDEHGQPLLV